MTYTESIEPQDTVCLVLLWEFGFHCVLLKSLPREAVSTPFPRSQWQIASFHCRTRVYLNFSTEHIGEGSPPRNRLHLKKTIQQQWGLSPFPHRWSSCPPVYSSLSSRPIQLLRVTQNREVVEQWSDRKVIVSWPSLALHDGGKQSRKTQLG